MEITQTLEVETRAEWRQWLTKNHNAAAEIWLLTYRPSCGRGILYLESVEEALCFGWIDSTAKKYDAERTAQRFTPRRPKSNWTELNKERARRLINQGLMTPAGYEALPDLSIEAFHIPDDILAELQRHPDIWANFQAFPDIYQRVRVGHIAVMRNRPDEFRKRLDNFLAKTKRNQMYGTWR